jgi:hypothetical protein
MRAMATTMRVAGNKEGEGGKAMAKVTKLVGKRSQWQLRGSGNSEEGGGQG